MSHNSNFAVRFFTGTVNNGFANGYFITYQIFLIFWITFGLGYIVMLLGFITSGMRSESVHRLEQKFANQFKSTQNRILQGFTRDMAVIRKIINEANVIKLKVSVCYIKVIKLIPSSPLQLNEILMKQLLRILNVYLMVFTL